MNKTCKSCGKTKPIEEFSKKKSNRDGYNARCKECTRQYTQDHYQNNKTYYINKRKRHQSKVKAFVNQQKARCISCGETEQCCLEFHHIDNSTKKFNLGDNKVKNLSYKEIQDEIDKCVVLCSNCHKKLHAGVLTLDMQG